MKTQPTFKIAIFQHKFSLWYIRLNIYMWKARFTSYKQYSFGISFSRNTKKTQNVRQAFLPCLKRNISQTFKCSWCKKLFPSMCIIFFCINLALSRGLVQRPWCYFLWNKCFEKGQHFMSVFFKKTMQCC